MSSIIENQEDFILIVLQKLENATFERPVGLLVRYLISFHLKLVHDLKNMSEPLHLRRNTQIICHPTKKQHTDFKISTKLLLWPGSLCGRLKVFAELLNAGMLRSNEGIVGERRKADEAISNKVALEKS
jgi:hypothetical protein